MRFEMRFENWLLVIGGLIIQSEQTTVSGALDSLECLNRLLDSLMCVSKQKYALVLLNSEIPFEF